MDQRELAFVTVKNGRARPARGGRGASSSSSTTSAPPASWDARTIWFANLVVLAVVVCFALLFRFAGALFILFAGVAVGMAVRPGVEWLRRHGVARWVGALALYAVLGCLAAGVLVLAVPLLIEQGEALIARAPHQIERLRNELLSSQSHTLQRIAWYLPATSERGGIATLDVTTLLRYSSALGRQPVHGRRGAAARVLLDAGRRPARPRAGAVRPVRAAARDPLVADRRRAHRRRLPARPVAGLPGDRRARVRRLPRARRAPRRDRRPGLRARRGGPGRRSDHRHRHRGAGRGVGQPVAGVRRDHRGRSACSWSRTTCSSRGSWAAPSGTSPLVTLLAITAFGSVLGISGAILAIPMAAIVQLLLYRFWLGAEAQHAAPPVGRDRLSAVRYEVQRADRRPAQAATACATAGARASTERVEDAVEGIAHDLDRLLAEREGRP